jgi:HD-GYP domain-containing protein (c-di-GMP phosphodiesterase class II)
LTALLSPAVYLKIDTAVKSFLMRGYKDRRQILLEMEQELIGVYRTSDVYPIVSTALVFAFDTTAIQFVKTVGHQSELEYSYPPMEVPVIDGFKGGMILPLIQKGDSRIVLGIGKKRDDDIFTKDDTHILTSAAAQVSKALENCELYRQLEESLANESDAQRTAILSLAKLTEYRDQETGRHLERIQDYSRLLALKLKDDKIDADYLNEDYIDALCLSSILHDIGKVGVPDQILLKPGKLTEDEFTIIKRHTMIGGKVLEDAENMKPDRSFLTIGKMVAYYHHEKWDGSGYPFGLAGDAIPLSARIVAVADVYDALRSDRPYKKAFSHIESIDIILEGKARHFDPKVVDAFLAIESRIESVVRD